MPAYILAVCDITDMNDNMKLYATKSAELIEKNGGRYILRGPSQQIVEGEKLDGAYVILTEFPTMDQLNAFWQGDEYQNDVAHLRKGTGTYHIAIYESP